MTFRKGSIRRSLYFSILDGLFTAMMAGASESYLVPYGIALGATPKQVALLASVPMLVATLLQLKSASVTQSIGSRTKLINRLVFFHALSWLPIVLIPFLFTGVLASWRPWALLVTATAFVSFGAFSVPAWQSLMSDYIPTRKRGRYFGWRNRLQGFFTVAVSVAAGLVLHAFGKDNLAGFTAIFVFAMLCRFNAWICLTRMVEPYRKSSHDVYFSFFDFLKQMRRSNFARFVLFVSLMSFAVNLSSPLLAVFLLKDLGFSYVGYMVVMTVALSSGFLFQGLWGRYGDAFGNWRITQIAGWGIAVLPLFWMISRDLRYLACVQLIGGSVWGGFNLLNLNFMMEAVTPEKRIRCISYFNVMNSFFVFAGAAAGGLLIHHLPPLFGYPYLTLFLVSFFVRSAVMLVFSGKVREVRQAAV